MIAAGASVQDASDSRPIGLILGSGLGGLAERVEQPTATRFANIPGLPSATVKGHAGTIIEGALAGQHVVVVAGRLHLYEGAPPAAIAELVRVLYRRGVRRLLVSNAAGGIRADIAPGSLMVIDDHINLMWRNPLVGPVRSDETRFPDMSAPYDRDLSIAFRAAAGAAGVATAAGVYAAVLGPSYETAAEIRMLGALGADAVGMSTVPEVLVARALGMRVVGVSCVTNRAAGLAGEPLRHEDVLQAANRVSEVFQLTVMNWLLAQRTVSGA